MAPKKQGRNSRNCSGDSTVGQGRGGRASAGETKKVPKREAAPSPSCTVEQHEAVKGALATAEKEVLILAEQKRRSPTAKRTKIEEVVDDPYIELCKTVGDGLAGWTKELPRPCHELFRALAVGSLPTPQCQRHAVENTAVEFLSSVMADVETSRARSVESAQEEVSEASRKKKALDDKWSVAVAQAKLKRAHADSRMDMLTDLQEAEKKANAEIAEKTALRERHAKDAVALVEEKAACEGALEFELVLIKDGASIVKNGVFIRPDDPKHVAKVQSLIARVGLDEGLLESFLIAAEKPLPFRSDFDKSVFPQVQTALENHIQKLHAKIASSDPAAVASQDDEAIRLAEMASALAHDQAETASEEVRIAKQEADKSENEANRLQKTAEEGATVLARADTLLQEATATLASFKHGTLKTFQELSERKNDIGCMVVETQERPPNSEPLLV